MKRLLVIGDIISDRYTAVTTERVAQEASIPVYDLSPEEEWYVPGGAANVAMNAAALSAGEFEIRLSGIANSSPVGALMDGGIVLWDEFIYSEKVVEKHRYVCEDKIVVRFDSRKKFSGRDIGEFENKILKTSLSDYDVIIVSDYDKGTITERIAEHVVKSRAKVIVDSKRYDLRPFAGAYALNVNENEYGIQVSNRNYVNVDGFFDYVLVTLGGRGCELHQCEKSKSDNSRYVIHTESFETKKVPVVDVTGCGDTHVAAFAIGLLRDGEDVRNAVRYANTCASIAVQRFGTSIVSKWDVTKELNQDL